MYQRQELMELRERVAEDGVRRHEGALHELAAAVATRLPGAAAVLRDSTAPNVLRERAFSVAADSVLRADTRVLADTVPRSSRRSDEPKASTRAERRGRKWQYLLNGRSQPAMWGV